MNLVINDFTVRSAGVADVDQGDGRVARRRAYKVLYHRRPVAEVTDLDGVWSINLVGLEPPIEATWPFDGEDLATRLLTLVRASLRLGEAVRRGRRACRRNGRTALTTAVFFLMEVAGERRVDVAVHRRSVDGPLLVTTTELGTVAAASKAVGGRPLAVLALADVTRGMPRITLEELRRW